MYALTGICFLLLICTFFPIEVSGQTEANRNSVRLFASGNIQQTDKTTLESHVKESFSSLNKTSTYCIEKFEGYTCWGDGLTSKLIDYSNNDTYIASNAFGNCSSGNILFKNGEYVFDQTLFLHSDLRIEGEGPTTILRWNVAVHGLLAVGHIGDEITNVTVENLTITAPRFSHIDQNSANGIYFYAVNDSYINNVDVIGTSCSNIRLNNCFRVNIARCQIQNGNIGILNVESLNSTIENNTISSQIGHGIDNNKAVNADIKGNYVISGRGGISFDDSCNITIENNTVSNCDEVGITGTKYDNTRFGSKFFTIVGNQISNIGFYNGTDGHGIRIVNSSYGLIENNTVEFCAASGMSLENHSTKNVLRTNTCKNNTDFGIYIASQDVTFSLVLHNQLTNNYKENFLDNGLHTMFVK